MGRPDPKPDRGRRLFLDHGTRARQWGAQRQVVRRLIDRQDGFLVESRDVLRPGLQTAGWMDHTGARHAGRNGFCTHIGNDAFTWFGTRARKSRLNFLDLLRAGHGDDVINAAALAYMRTRSLAGPVLSRLTADRRRLRSSSAFIRGAKTASPASMANWQSRSWCARQTCHSTACPCWAL
jgi:hypothetical protein